jgi:hypothetical protein
MGGNVSRRQNTRLQVASVPCERCECHHRERACASLRAEGLSVLQWQISIEEVPRARSNSAKLRIGLVDDGYKPGSTPQPEWRMHVNWRDLAAREGTSPCSSDKFSS